MRWAWLLMGLVGCGGGAVGLPPPPVTCGASNCQGCCTARGTCADGTSDLECGGRGEACLSCGAGRLCVSNACGVEPLPVGAKLVFVTRSTFTGNLGGVEGADALCMAAAAAGNLPGTFKAWVSANGYDSVARVQRMVNASERLTSAGPWYLPGVDSNGRRIQVFANRAALRAAPLKPIDRTETLEPAPSTGRGVWTGTLATGLADRPFAGMSNGTCADWRLSSDDSDQGISGTVFGQAGDWTEFTRRGCSQRQSLYCFED
jgi:hypothetical protein